MEYLCLQDQLAAQHHGFWDPTLNFGPSSSMYVLLYLLTSPTGQNHECHLLVETDLESSANIFMLFGFRRIGETKHHILVVNQHLGLKEALTSRIVFWRPFSSSVLFLRYSRRNVSTCSQIRSEMVTAYAIPSLPPYLAIHHIIPSSFYKLHPQTQNFCIALSFKRVTLCFPRTIIQDT